MRKRTAAFRASDSIRNIIGLCRKIGLRFLCGDTLYIIQDDNSGGSSFTSVVETHVEFETECDDFPLTVFGIRKLLSWQRAEKSRQKHLGQYQGE